MFDEYLSGKKIKDIVVMLKDKGIKNGYGKDWSINSVSRVLRNENYKGVVYADDTIYTNIYPAIVSEDIFDEVNARLKVSKRTSSHHKTEVNYLLITWRKHSPKLRTSIAVKQIIFSRLILNSLSLFLG